MKTRESTSGRYVLSPALWLMILIAGLAQLSDAFISSLPDMAGDLQVPAVLIEYTLTTYLGGFAMGMLSLGKLSDYLGRRPCVLAGLILFVIGCTGCCVASTIEILMASRFLQGLGSSVGIIMVQVICRDAFRDKMLGKAYATIESTLAIVPSLGAFIDSLISEHYGWRAIFLILILFAVVLIVVTTLQLPETHPPFKRKYVSMLNVGTRLCRDKKVIGYGLIMAACLGISFSYYAEGAFYLVEMLGLSPRAYDVSFIATGASYMAGSMLSKHLTNHHASQKIMAHGLNLIVSSSASFCSLVVLHVSICKLPAVLIIWTVFLSQMGIMFGSGLMISNILALALVNYKQCLGTASSWFGFFYYALISLFTFGMGALHNGTLLPMPWYFIALSIFMLIVRNTMINHKSLCQLTK